MCFRNKYKRTGKDQNFQSKCLKDKQGFATLKTDLKKNISFCSCCLTESEEGSIKYYITWGGFFLSFQRSSYMNIVSALLIRCKVLLVSCLLYQEQIHWKKLHF